MANLRDPRTWTRALTVGVVVVTVAGSGGTAAGADVPPAPEGWELVWGDDFDGPAGTLPSAEHWLIDLGHSYPGGPDRWGTGEIQRYTDSTDNVSLDGSGNLLITPLRDATGGWTSARIETRRTNFKPPAGGVLRIEGRIRMPDVTGPAAAGYWGAFWALGAPYRGNYQNWPGIGEIDVMESVNGLNQTWGTLHCGINPGGPCNETVGHGSIRECPGQPCQTAFHTFGVEWDDGVTPRQMRWYVDGEQYHSVTADQIGAPHWANMTGHEGYFLLLNVAVGGAFPDAVAGAPTPTAGTVPGRPMVVDHVAVYERSPGR